jgi:hypothetical protein
MLYPTAIIQKNTFARKYGPPRVVVKPKIKRDAKNKTAVIIGVIKIDRAVPFTVPLTKFFGSLRKF